MTEWIQLGGLFLAVGALTFVLVSLVMRRPERSRQRVDSLPDGEHDDAPPLLLGDYTEALSETLPSRKGPATDLQTDLRSAGYYRPTAVIEYKAVRNLIVLIVVLATAAVALAVPENLTIPTLLCGLAGMVLGFSLPRVFVMLRGRWRSRAVERGLPLAIDMLILCLSAGQNLLAALQQVSRQLRKNHPVLAQELIIAHQQAELHSLEHALKQWAQRMRLPEVRNLVMLLIQSEKLGADAAATLSELAMNFRVTARQRAEAQANRTSFWMLFPSVFCFWVAAAIILIGPAYLEYFQYQQHLPEGVTNVIQNVQRANRENLPPPPPAAPGEQP